jgi:diguanylate cyclase (GGDEF)-like protein
MSAPRRFTLVTSTGAPAPAPLVPAERDERETMARWGGALWLLAAAVAAAGQIVPGVPHEHGALVWVLTTGLAAYGAACLWGVIPWSRLSINWHLAAVLTFMPVIGLGMWATGGINSYIAPILPLAMLYIAYFFPTRMAWIAVSALVLAAATPLLYTPIDEDLALARVLAFAITCEGFTLTLQALKGRLISAERRQRELAHIDALTGVANRRGFDVALTNALRAAGAPTHGRRSSDTAPRVALLLVDLDDYKLINDHSGNTAGDGVLRQLARRADVAIRPGDCLARIGGDELALVAPGAGERGALRLSSALVRAAAEVRPAPDAPAVSLTVAWALYPRDGHDEAELFQVADQRLHASKGHRPAHRHS